MFEKLLQPLDLGPTWVRNRVFNPPHGTTLGHRGVVSDELVAYHRARAEGGTGLIILEGMTIHPSYGFEDAFLYAGKDEIIPGMEKLGNACRQHGTPVFGQLFHAGRAVRLSHDGSKPVTYSASDTPDERYRVVPVPMPNEMVWEIIESYTNAAARLVEANLDGVEILASMGYLIAQFINPYTNHREDEFGGSFDNRLRLLREILCGVRQAIGEDKTLGIRITLDEKSDDGPDTADMVRVCEAIDADGKVDYFSVISGTSATPGGWVHVFPPMAIPHGFVANDAALLKQSLTRPVLVAGRINQPQLAESILADGKADMVGMARALIADPDFVNKFANGKSESIRACIGCNQACVGHRLAHHAVSCIQNPRSGRELEFKPGELADLARSVLVVGAGPGGMKAAVTAAQRGHRVLLLEKTSQIGGQVRLAEKLPRRAEFGGVTTNLARELQSGQVEVTLEREISESLLAEFQPDAIIVATGATPRMPDVDVDGVDFIDSWSAIQGEHKIGQNVVVADWSCDWSGLGIAHKLALDGHFVRLLCGASVPGESIQGIVRDHWIGELHMLNVEMIPFVRFYGAARRTAYFQHMTSGNPVECEDVDTVISCYALRASNLATTISQFDYVNLNQTSITIVGDALAPRTVEEAVLEGYRAAWFI